MANLGSGFMLKVTPEELKTVSSQVEPLIRKMSEDFNTISELMDSTAGYWLGDAGDMYRKTYKQKEDHISEMIARLSEHPRDLLTMAGVYESSERENVSRSEPLPSDVIS